MATYRMLNPALAEVTHDTGQSIVVPMSEQDAQANGLTPAQAPGGIPLPQGNPVGGLPATAGAGPGGGDPADLSNGGADMRAMYGQPNPEAFRAQLGIRPAAGSHESAPAPDRFSVAAPPAAEKPRLISVAGEAPAAEQQRELDPVVAQAMKEAARSQGGRPTLGITSETKKYFQPGAVDPALAADISQRQSAVDQGASDTLEDQAAHKLDYLSQQEELQQAEAQRVQAAMQRRQAVDNQIADLKAKSDAQQQALMNARPKTVDEFWQSRGAATQIAAAAALALGAWGTTLRGGGENPGMQLVNQAIDRWSNDQRQQYEAAKDKASLSNNVYKQMVDEYGTPELAQTNLQLQALAAKDALLKNHAEQIGTPDALAAAQLELQKTALQRQQLQAQAQQQAGAQVEATLRLQGGGSGGILQALRAGAEAKKLTGEIEGTTLDERKFGLEEKKVGAAGSKAATVNSDAADAIAALRRATSTVGGRSPGEGGGKAAALKAEAEASYAAALTANGVSARAALTQAKELFSGADSTVRGVSQDAKLLEAEKLLRGHATRAAARRAGGLDEPAANESQDVGEPE